MKFEPFWTDNYPRPVDLPVAVELPSEIDVAIIGGGYTGLSAARTLTKNGVSVAVLERETIGWGASSRNAGITSCGLKVGAPTIFKRYGEEKGFAFWEASLAALELIKELVHVEGIDCDLQPFGDLVVAFKASHMDSLKAKVAWHQRVLGHELRIVSSSELRTEIGSNVYYGGIVDEHGAGLHPAKLVYGLAEVAAKYGTLLFEGAYATGITKNSQGFEIHTNLGMMKAKQVLIATNGYTDQLVRHLKPRIIPVGSYSIVTEVLSEDLRRELSPKGLMFWDTKWFLNYFRLTPDGRMLWGGRNNLSTDLDLDVSTRILQGEMARAFPQLSDVPITHSWSGQLAIAFDMMPHIGNIDGIYYALGYGGHGLHTALFLGHEVGLMLSGKKSSSPFADLPHQSYFFYRNNPWFLPFAVLYYRFLDWKS